MKTEFTSVVAALCVAGAAWGAPARPAAPPAPMSKEAYEAAGRKIDAQYKAERKACAKLDDNARDVCEAQAKGRRKALHAQLDARYEPSPEAEKDAKTATADASYGVAKARCDALEGKAEDRCMKQAKAAREAAIRQAKVEKVEETGGLFGGHSSAGGKAAPRPKS